MFIQIILLLSLFNLSILTAQTGEIKQLDAKDFHQLTDQKEVTILDVRTPGEYKNGHLDKAGLLNFYASDFKSKLLLLPQDSPVYLYCNTGYRSYKAAQYLVKNGYTEVYNMAYGIMQWYAYELPFVVDKDAQTDKDNAYDSSAFDEAINATPLVFVDFYAPWCAPCRQMLPMIDSLKVAYHQEVKIIKVNADASKQLIKDLKVNTVPYLVLYKNGTIVFSQEGIMTKESIIELLDNKISAK